MNTSKRLVFLFATMLFLAGCGAPSMVNQAQTRLACEQNGVRYDDQSSVPSNDCNTCRCENGAVMCTELGCL